MFLPNYCFKNYDYIVKCCSGIACTGNWCVSLDIALFILAEILSGFLKSTELGSGTNLHLNYHVLEHFEWKAMVNSHS